METIDLPLTETDQISLTEGAVRRVRKLIEERELSGYALRVFVSGGGCSGMQYGMGLEPEPRENDLRFSFDDVPVVVDPMSISYLAGTVIDYTHELMGGGFRIENPNAVSACGCGHSFRTAESSDAHTHSRSDGCC